MKIESLFGDFDSPGAVGPLLGEHEAVALVQLARSIQSQERSEKNAPVPCVSAELERGVHESLADAPATVSVVDDEKTQARGFRRLRAIDGDAADDFIVLGSDPEAVSFGVEAREKLAELVGNLRLEVATEVPIAGVVAPVQLDQPAYASGKVFSDLHQAVSENSSRPISQRRISEVPAPIS